MALDTLTLGSRTTTEFTRSQTALSTLRTSLWQSGLDDLDGITRLRVVTTETLNALNEGRIALVSVQALTEFAWNQVIRAFSEQERQPARCRLEAFKIFRRRTAGAGFLVKTAKVIDRFLRESFGPIPRRRLQRARESG